MASPRANRHRKYLSTLLLIVAVTGGAAIGWVVGRWHMQAMVDGVDTVVDAIFVSRFHDAGIYDFLVVIYTVVGAALGLAIVAIPTVLMRLFKSGCQFRAAKRKYCEESTQSIENAH
jgi:hypothetical protein